nr:hypothetical protein A6C57_01850 [Fibrella sp. ES10-3-2-2]
MFTGYWRVAGTRLFVVSQPMPKHVRKWVLQIALNFIGLLFSLAVMYVVSVIVVLQLSTRATAKNPLQDILNYESFVFVIGLVAIWFIFRFIGKIYTLLSTPPRPE